MLRFIHITDTHIGPTPEFELYGRRPLPYLAKLVDTINALPFEADFVLHTGDVSEDRSAASYELARSELTRLRLPVKYVVGNHDDAAMLRRVLLDDATPAATLRYTFDHAGVRFVVLDSNGVVKPGGEVGEEQRAWLAARLGDETPAFHREPASGRKDESEHRVSEKRAGALDKRADTFEEHAISFPACGFAGTPDSSSQAPPVVVVLHHHPVALDCPWLDFRGDDWPAHSRMDMPDRGALLDVLAPHRDRIRGVFFGHVHHAFTATLRGITFNAAPSSFCQLRSWPTDRIAVPDAAPGGFSVVTITDDGQTLVRHAQSPLP